MIQSINTPYFDTDIPKTIEYCPADLYRTYVLVFCRKPHFGLKATYQAPEPTEDFDVFITRARFLLTVVKEKHIHDLLSFMDDEKNLYFGWSALAAGAWMGGLLKHRAFLEKIIQLVYEGGYPYQSLAWHTALLLYEDPELSRVFIEAISKYEVSFKRGDPGNRHYALACLEILDEKYNLNNASPLIKEKEKANVIHCKNRIERVIKLSTAIRAEIAFDSPPELIQRLKEILRDTSPPEFYAMGIFNENNVEECRAMTKEIYSVYVQPKIGKIKKEYSYYANLKLAMPFYAISHLVPEDGEPDIFRPLDRKTEQVLLLQTVKFLSGEDTRLLMLWAHARSSDNIFDILSSLDVDINNKLPIDLVDFLYDKLASLVPFSYQLCEQNAYDLLLRGHQCDEKARRLLREAESLKNKYVRKNLEYSSWYTAFENPR
ncbi:hypothetical protein [Aliikangiella coralliicola]|uniref:Uncharacterized protein n=1 Tax=Aliikangiella coralliicola TaxID=2592383 RepID=A0A545UFM0_9GAMM|nr:hypothetical protein [Aliikangiella coralliicola]TQV88245.1 hypothetical protein FLL46_06885 [Aliikangiella coralliicola]